MGHVLFVILHIVAVLFGLVWLILTIPLHLIYAAVSERKPPRVVVDPNAPSPSTHVRCPDCRELVRADAVKCKHCGSALVPVDMKAFQAEAAAERKAEASSTVKAMAITLGIVLVMGFIAITLFKR